MDRCGKVRELNMAKPLLDYTGRCGACKHFAFYIIKGVLKYRGNCECANQDYFMNRDRNGVRYRAKHSAYRQASQKCCKKYEQVN